MLMKTPFQFCRVHQVSLFQAPPVERVSPYQIAAGQELVELILSGVVYVEKDGERVRLGRGALFWEREGEWTLSDTSAKDPYACLVVKVELLADPPVRPPFLSVLSDAELPRILAEDLMRGFHREKVDRDLFSVSAYTRLAWAALSAPATRRLPSVLQAVLQEIHRNLSGDLQIQTLCRLHQISETRLRQLFARHLDSAPHRYILEQRLRESRLRLASGHPSIKEVGAACGFASSEVFCRCFKARFGLTPGAYRDQQQR